MARNAAVQEDSSLRVQPQQKRAREKVEAILAATARLLDREGVEAVNMVAIAREAGLPPATTYHYFENRLGIFAALAERAMQDIDDRIMALMLKMGESSSPDLRSLIGELYEAYRSAPGLMLVLPLLRATPALREIITESNRRTSVVLALALGSMTPLDEQRLQRVARMTVEAVQAQLELALQAESEAEAQAIVDEMKEMVGCLFQHYTQGAR